MSGILEGLIQAVAGLSGAIMALFGGAAFASKGEAAWAFSVAAAGGVVFGVSLFLLSLFGQ